jgi:hypothetical protein
VVLLRLLPSSRSAGVGARAGSPLMGSSTLDSTCLAETHVLDL